MGEIQADRISLALYLKWRNASTAPAYFEAMPLTVKAACVCVVKEIKTFQCCMRTSSFPPLISTSFLDYSVSLKTFIILVRKIF